MIRFARIVEALEVLAGEQRDEQIDRLAQHAFRGQVWDKAATYSQQAGAKASDRAAFREAVTCFDQALTGLAPVLPYGSRQADLRLVRLPPDGHAEALGGTPPWT